MVFGDNMNMRFGLGEEGNLNFLFFDDVSRTQRSSAAGKATRRAEQQSAGEKISCKRARHDLEIVAGNGSTAKAQVPKAMENQRL